MALRVPTGAVAAGQFEQFERLAGAGHRPIILAAVTQ
jgi:hypothetical protein